MTYNSEVLADAPIEYWKLDETSGTSAASAGSGAHALTHSAGVVVGAAGKLAQGTTYDGVSAASTTTNVADFMSGAFTVEFWTKFGTPVMDYPTFIRRDGGGFTFIVRTRNPNQTRGNIIETYYNGRTVDTGSTTFNDNNWHHVVVTRSGTTLRLFIDNVEYTTGNGTATNGGSGSAAVVNIGQGSGTTEFLKGSMDEVAIYTTALTPTRIGAHYTAMPTAVNTTVLPTASAVTVATAPAPVVTAVDNLHQSYTATADKNTAAGGGTSTTIAIGNGRSGGFQSMFQFSTPTIPAGMTVASAQLVLVSDNTSSTTTSVDVKLATSAWTEANTNSPTSTSASYGSGTIVQNSVNSIDVTAAVQAWAAGTTNLGLVLFSTGSAAVYTRENGTNQPKLNVTLAVSTNMTVNPPASTLSVASVVPSVTATSDTISSATVATMTIAATTAAAFSPDVVARPTAAEIAVVASVPSVFSPLGKVITLTGAGGMTVAATTLGISLDTQRTVMVDNAAGMTLRMVGVLNTEQDRYFKALKGTTDWDDMWLKLDEISGTIAADSSPASATAGDFATVGTYVGDPLLNIEGPQLHKAVHFDGIDDKITTGAFNGSTTFTIMDTTIEFSIKTTQSNGTILAGGPIDGTNGFLNSGYEGSEIRLVDGQLALYNGNTIKTLWPVRKFIADGEWHHVVISLPSVSGNAANLPGSLRPAPFFVTIDGVLQWSRYQATLNGAAFLPGVWMNGVAGDLSNAVARTNYAVSQDTALSLYYEWSNTTLAKAVPAAVSMSGVNPTKAGGNVKKMIALYGLPLFIDEDSGNGARDGFGTYYSIFAGFYIKNDAVTAPGGPGGAMETFDLESNGVKMNYLRPKTFMLEGYMVYPVAIMHQAGSNGGPFSVDGMENRTYVDPIEGVYIDDLTGLPRFIDLDLDLAPKVTDFDALTVVNYPALVPEDALDSGGIHPIEELREPRQHSMGLTRGEWQTARDRLRDSIMKAAQRGVSLWITEPEMAQHCGFITSYDKHETGARIEFYGPGNIDATGYTNTKAYDLDVAHLTGADATQNAGRAQRGIGQYNYTWQSNAKRKIVDIEPGLTDLPSYEYGDTISYLSDDNFKPYARYMAYDVLDRETGLRIGDQLGMEMWEQNGPGLGQPWSVGNPRKFIISAHPDGIAGKVISREMDSYYGPNGSVRSNPWKNNAYTIIAERGTIVNGRPIGGRAFIELMDPAVRDVKILVDMDKFMWHGSKQLTAQSSWDYDSRRYLEVATVKIIKGSTTRIINHAKVNEYFERELRYVDFQDGNYIFRPYMSMNARGLNWIAQAGSLNPGDARTFVNAVDVKVEAVKPTVVPTRNMTVTVTQPARVSIEARLPRNFYGPDSVQTVLPAEMTIEARGIGSTIQVGPAALGVSMPDVNVRGSGDSIFVYLDAERSVTLFMKED